MRHQDGRRSSQRIPYRRPRTSRLALPLRHEAADDRAHQQRANDRAGDHDERRHAGDQADQRQTDQRPEDADEGQRSLEMAEKPLLRTLVEARLRGRVAPSGEALLRSRSGRIPRCP